MLEYPIEGLIIVSPDHARVVLVDRSDVIGRKEEIGVKIGIIQPQARMIL